MQVLNSYYDFRKRADTEILLQYGIADSNTPYIKSAQISATPICFYNGCTMRFDLSSLPPSCVDVADLSNKHILYGIYCNGKVYVGKTNDFGERMMTHIKDSKKPKTDQRLYKDMIKEKECFAFVFGIMDTKEQLDSAEHSIISLAKDFSIENHCKGDKSKISFIKESNQDIKKYSQCFCYNVIG